MEICEEEEGDGQVRASEVGVVVGVESVQEIVVQSESGGSKVRRFDGRVRFVSRLRHRNSLLFKLTSLLPSL